MNKTIKILKISALAAMLTALSGCDEPQHPVYGFTQLDPYLAIFVVFAVFAVGSFLWGVWSMIDFRKNLTNQSYRGELFKWSNVNVNIPGTENSNEQTTIK
jgi:lipoprotein